MPPLEDYEVLAIVKVIKRVKDDRGVVLQEKSVTGNFGVIECSDLTSAESVFSIVSSSVIDAFTVIRDGAKEESEAEQTPKPN